MSNEPNSARQTTPSNILESISNFRQKNIDLKQFLDILMDQIYHIQHIDSIYIGELEDAWTDMEIIYVLALEAGQTVLTGEQAAEVEDAIDRLADAVSKAL